MSRNHPRWHPRWLASAAAFTLVLTVSGAAAGAAGAQPPPAAVQARPLAAAPADPVTLTLLTGDRVRIQQLPGGEQAVEIDPAPRADEYPPSFDTLERDQDLYVIPSDAARLVPDLLDQELFNVSKLAGYGYTGGIPVITTYRDRTAARSAAAAQSAAAMPGATVTADLPSIDGQAVTIDGTAWWPAAGDDLATTGTADSRQSPASGPLAGADRVWLDEQVAPSLDVSVPLIGAPQAWADGFDGTGVTVAVLDTGIDASHPDLTGQVAGAENFTDSDTASDRHGHGTHVGGTVAGTGAASGGQYVGVAPGAELLNGKVLGDTGSGQSSWAIAAMQWAAEAGADVVNMSLGTDPADGTDPMSQAVNRITAEQDVLFVIAAGNNGSRDYTIGAPGAADAALTVGSVSKSEQLATTSSRGPRLSDHAVKPDVTAPGVDIVSARATGTSRGTPVNEHYTILSGTSMATPHVAGAAAILRQAEPDLAAGQVKARFAGTGVPRDTLDVYQQGGGRVDVPAALAAPVTATPAPLDLGFFPYPRDGVEPVQSELTYANHTTEPVTLDLSMAVASRRGDPAGERLSVTPDQVTVPANGTAAVTVTLDPAAGPAGLYGGYLLAETGGELATRTPVGFYLEPELVELTVHGIARDGRPATRSSGVGVVNVDDATVYANLLERYVDGTATLAVPPGTYSVMGLINTYDGSGVHVQDRTLAGDPEVEVTEDTTLTFDARDGNPISVDTPGHESGQLGNVMFGYWRGDPHGGSFQNTLTGPETPLYAVPTDPVDTGGFELVSRVRYGAPDLGLQVRDPEQRDLRVKLMSGSVPAVDGDETLPLVEAGSGTAAEYDGIDAAGKVVLVRRTPGIRFAEQEAAAAAAGARALVVANHQSGLVRAFAGNNATIPTMSLSMEDGDYLLDLLAGQDVTVRLFGTPATPFLYDLVRTAPDQIPADLDYVTDDDQLVRLKNRFHGDVAGYPIRDIRHFWRPWATRSILISENTVAGLVRTEHVIGDPDTRYQQQVYAGKPLGLSLEPITRYQPGEHRQQSWHRKPAHPGVIEGGPHDNSVPMVRDGNELTMQIPEWVDRTGHWGFRDTGVDTTAFRLYLDGVLAAELERAGVTFVLPAEQHEYRMELDVDRDAEWWATSTATRTAWTLQSARTESAEVVPLLLVDYELPVDLQNTAPAPGEQRGAPLLELQVRHQPGAAGPAIAGVRTWLSYDDGQSWLSRPVRAVGDGEYQAVLPFRPPADSSGFASVRVEAWDADGNRIDQVITRAWRL